jgi:hypothetical protein
MAGQLAFYKSMQVKSQGELVCNLSISGLAHRWFDGIVLSD